MRISCIPAEHPVYVLGVSLEWLQYWIWGKFMKLFLSTGLAAATIASSAIGAEERIEINNVYPMNQETFQLSEGIFFTQDNRGYFEVVEGPLEDGVSRCVGSGFGFSDGTNTIDGICIFGEGDDTFTMSWKAGEQGAANTWVIVNGTGKFKGISGEGIATTDIEVMYRAMPLRQTHIVGKMDIPK